MALERAEGGRTSSLIAQTVTRYEKYLNPFWNRQMRLLGLEAVALKARGSYIMDTGGKAYLDCGGGDGSCFLGHNHPAITRAVKKQLERMTTNSRFLMHESWGELAELLAEHIPGDLRYTCFFDDGAEAVAGAIELACLAQSKRRFITTGETYDSRWPAQHLQSAWFTAVPFGNLDVVEEQVDESTAAVMVEPCRDEEGVRIPVIGYLKGLRRICDRYDLLLIINESRITPGRTGYLFACEAEDVLPDILVLGKGLGAGLQSLGALIARPVVWGGVDRTIPHFFGVEQGHLLACAVTQEALQVLIQGDMLTEVKEKGLYLQEHLQAFSRIYPTIVKEVQGRGLLASIVMTCEGARGVVLAKLLEQKVLVGCSARQPAVISLEPSYLITCEEIDYLAASLENAIKFAEAALLQGV